MSNHLFANINTYNFTRKFAYFKYSNYICTIKLANTHSMDLITRLKIFMDNINVPVTKFADICNIPRPSMTQLLKGRNKKVSDEVIAKIHAAYPALNISWLMFGEGDMTNDSNFQFSTPQNSVQKDNLPRLSPNSQDHPQDATDLFSFGDFSPENFTREQNLDDRQKSPVETSLNDKNIPSKKEEFQKPRHVTSIMVFYSDNSFESFVPQNR